MTKPKKTPVTIGHRGYLKKKKIVLSVRSLILLAGVALLIMTGYFTTGSLRNWLTIVGLVTAIPFAMQFATLLSMLKYRERPYEEYQQVKSAVRGAVFDTELLVANKDGASYYFPYVLFDGSGILAFLESPKPDPKVVSDYIRNYLRLHESDGELTVYQDYQSFLNAIRALTPVSRDEAPELLLKQEGVFRAISM